MCTQLGRKSATWTNISWDQLASLQERGRQALVARFGNAASTGMQTRITATKQGLFAATSLVIDNATHIEIVGRVGLVDLTIAARARKRGSETELVFEITNPVRMGPYITKIKASNEAKQEQTSAPQPDIDLPAIAKCMVGVPEIFADCLGSDANVDDFWKESVGSASRSVLA
jgi:hypothetical protein